MAQQFINIGTIPNDGTGDVMRNAFTKVDNNFSELYFTSANLTSNLSNLSTAVNVFEGLIYNQASAAFDVANAAFSLANNQATATAAAYDMANTVNSNYQGALTNATAAFNLANSFSVKINTNYTTTNSAYAVANAAFNYANSISNTALIAFTAAAFDTANDALAYASGAYNSANAALTYATIINSNVVSAYNFANGVSANTTAAYRVANSGFNVANVAYGASNAVFFKTNSSFAVANAAYATANAKVNTVNGVVTGTFTVTGTHQITGSQIITGNQSIIGQAAFTGPNNLFEIIDGYIYLNGTLWSPTPPGTIIYTASQTVPTGFLAADGATVSRTTYAALFDAIGTTFGQGDTITTFGLPDLRGVFLRGWDNSRGIDTGRSFGSDQLDLFKSHTHTDAGHNHQYAKPSTTTQALGFSGSNYTHPQSAPNATTENGFANIQATGGSETRPRNVALLACIKF